MMQLTYQPAFDPYHAVYRFLRLREAVLQTKTLHEDQLKILDFYLLFPFRLDALRVQTGHRKYRKLAAQFSSKKPYGELPEDRVLFERMDSIQTAALDTLAIKGLIDEKLYLTGTISSTSVQLVGPLKQRVEADNEAESELVEFLTVLASDYELLGSNGLKDRSRLMEYRYDAV